MKTGVKHLLISTMILVVEVAVIAIVIHRTHKDVLVSIGGNELIRRGFCVVDRDGCCNAEVSEFDICGGSLAYMLKIEDEAFVEWRRKVKNMNRTPWQIAEKWYSEQEISEAIANNRKRVAEGMTEHIPHDVQSEEFAKWLTHQYRLAMAKGIQLGRDGSQDQ